MPIFVNNPSLVNRVLVHFRLTTFDVVLSVLKLLDKIFSLFIISDINPIFVLLSHSHKAFFVSSLYPLYVQFASHNDKLLSIYSFRLSSNTISVPFSVV